MARAGGPSHMLLRTPDNRPTEAALGCRRRALSAKTRSADRRGLPYSGLERIDQARRTTGHLQRRAPFEDGLDQPGEGLPGLGAFIQGCRLALVATQCHGRVQWDAGQQGSADLFGKPAAAPAPEKLVAFAVGACKG